MTTPYVGAAAQAKRWQEAVEVRVVFGRLGGWGEAGEGWWGWWELDGGRKMQVCPVSQRNGKVHQGSGVRCDGGGGGGCRDSHGRRLRLGTDPSTLHPVTLAQVAQKLTYLNLVSDNLDEKQWQDLLRQVRASSLPVCGVSHAGCPSGC